MPWCPKCEGYISGPTTPHRCPPTWRVRLPSYHGDDGFDEITAPTAERAAAKFGEQYDQGGDYTVVSGSPIDVVVSNANGENERAFTVEGEAVATYYAREMKPKEEKDGGGR